MFVERGDNDAAVFAVGLTAAAAAGAGARVVVDAAARDGAAFWGPGFVVDVSSPNISSSKSMSDAAEVWLPRGDAWGN